MIYINNKIFRLKFIIALIICNVNANSYGGNTGPCDSQDSNSCALFCSNWKFGYGTKSLSSCNMGTLQDCGSVPLSSPVAICKCCKPDNSTCTSIPKCFYDQIPNCKLTCTVFDTYDVLPSYIGFTN